MNKKEKSLDLVVFELSTLHKAFALFSIISMTMMVMLFPAGSNGLFFQQTNAKSLSTDNTKVIKNFIAHGNISSIVYTSNGNWNAHGIWAMVVSNGKVTSFNTNMIFNNGTVGHSHEFQNFIGKKNYVGLSKDQSVIFSGKMDVRTNGVGSWFNVPTQINIEKGKIITILLDNKQTHDHFGGQSIHGSVDSIKPCNTKPGPQMQVPTANCN